MLCGSGCARACAPVRVHARVRARYRLWVRACQRASSLVFAGVKNRVLTNAWHARVRWCVVSTACTFHGVWRFRRPVAGEAKHVVPEVATIFDRNRSSPKTAAKPQSCAAAHSRANVHVSACKQHRRTWRNNYVKRCSVCV
eukprot:6198245-Pleurochrysis_carterae.AAC.2